LFSPVSNDNEDGVDSNDGNDGNNSNDSSHLRSAAVVAQPVQQLENK
jgi:hypothetical protein